MNPIFKHQSEMDRLSTACPPADSIPKEGKAFRWVFDEMSDERNFMPHYFRHPGLVHEFGDLKKCRALGRSMFDSLSNARIALLFRLESLNPRTRARKETQIAEGAILDTEGLCGPTDAKGHFTFHPVESSTFETRFSVIERI